jgi:hypothetical protein
LRDKRLKLTKGRESLSFDAETGSLSSFSKKYVDVIFLECLAFLYGGVHA